MTLRHIAIVGGGYAGTIQALSLLRHSSARVTLIERTGRLPRGAAYSTRHPDHLLNVRASKMSAFADAPAHFEDWLSKLGAGDGASFAQRRLYGAYLEELFEQVSAEAGERLQVVAGEAVAVTSDGEGESVRLAGGETVHADAVILSIGNLPPNAPTIPADLPPGVFVADPWAGDIAAGLSSGDHVLLIGTGLTAIDAALTLDAAGFEGRIAAISRRGMVPRPHDRRLLETPELLKAPSGGLADMTQAVRKNAERIGWQPAIDQLRPHTQALWASAPPERRMRFLRHLRPYWDVHRHRIAPEIGDRIDVMQRDGRLSFEAGKLVSVEPSGAAAKVVWRRRGAAGTEELCAARIVNCTGPRGNVTRSGEPLLDQLVSVGRIRPDPCRIGIDIDSDCRAIASDGTPAASLYAIGPMTRGALWEVVAVPDIRVQADGLARQLAG
ncbi:MAG TPA: FAD/NAD(P)-binding protein [Allosphingosinicella sp.]|nr:FAD/NAD(P)-binding protein [Allosphingosinicella sp.]